MSDGVIFQMVVLGGAFALAGMIFLLGMAWRRKHDGDVVTGRVGTQWVWPIDLGGVMGFCVVFGLFGFSSAILSAEKTAEKEASVEGLLGNLLIFLFLLGVTVFLVHRRCGVVEWLGLRWKQWYLVLLSPVAVVVMWMVLGGLNGSGYIEWMEAMSGGSSTQEAVRMLRENQDVVVVGLMAFMAVVLAPVVEEVIFRGYIYPVAKRFGGMVPAVVFSSLVFAAGHGNATLLLPLFLLGSMLAVAYEKTGSVWMPMAIHGCFNGATVLIQLLVRAGVIELPKEML